MVFCLFFSHDRASELKTAIRSKNQTLRQLNQVLNICFLLTADSSLNKPIRCHGVAEWRRLLRDDFLELTCFLENCSPFAFEQGWTLSVTVFPPSCPPSRGGGNTSQSFSFPFNGVGPGETFQVVLPLSAAGDASLPMTVNCSLVFTFSGVLAEEEADLLGSQHSFTLPLDTLMVDWLHVLRVGGGGGTAAPRPQCAIRAFLNSRRIRWEAGATSASEVKSELFSASVRLSSALIGSLRPREPQGETAARRHVCVSLLDYLLACSCRGVKPGKHNGQVGGSLVHAL